MIHILWIIGINIAAFITAAFLRSFFVDMAKREHSQQLAKAEADYIIETGGSGFEGAAKLLDEYVSDRWNLNAGFDLAKGMI